MAEWKLFQDDKLPWFLEPGAMTGQPWMNLSAQPGFPARAKLVTDLVRMVRMVLEPHWSGAFTVVDLGCGDGELLERACQVEGVRGMGFELGIGDVQWAQAHGRDVRQADILQPARLGWLGDLVVCSEVLEHLQDPAGFLVDLRDAELCPEYLIASSPSMETADWHNEIHAWAWDKTGYRDLLKEAGWRVAYQADCDGGWNDLMGVTKRQRFQAIVAVR